MLRKFCSFWTEQDGTERQDHLTSVIAGDNGSVIMSGHTRGVFQGKMNAGHEDAVAIKLDRNGAELWRWQVRKEQVHSFNNKISFLDFLYPY